ncbi:Fe-S protein assembly co-chaperone HscB [Granulicella sp. 5B5]|uniref:Fe-S protein assembly co-chaperone HscB n=1 Tax=Granulicella sp. 5B5 TaxID=1617967 RepID=UPI0015F352B2|nr:Fe-S protein assembly co-chaperone HscB [Granulicella sp. 5B5]QMV18981.1 Fe-S protein assembly co-chaperone HscB [Granulicella sp. 5B5]
MSDTYFTQFGLPPHLHIDTAALEKSFYAQSRKLHPDRFAARPLEEQNAALAASSTLNDAYRTLRDPIARTEYLLTLEGIQLEEQSRAATDLAKSTGTQKKQVAPPDLLEEAFELNMALEELKMGGDDPYVRAQLETERTKFAAMLTDAHQQLESLWTQWDTAVDTNNAAAKDAAKQAMVALLNRRSYIRNLVRDVNAALEEFPEHLREP